MDSPSLCAKSCPKKTITLLPRNLNTQNCCLCNFFLFTLKSSLFQGEQSQPSQSFLIGDLLHASDHLGLPLDLLQKVNVLPGLRTPELDGALQWDLSSAEQRDRITNLLATLPLVQPRIGWLSGLQQHIGLDL